MALHFPNDFQTEGTAAVEKINVQFSFDWIRCGSACNMESTAWDFKCAILRLQVPWISVSLTCG